MMKRNNLQYAIFLVASFYSLNVQAIGSSANYDYDDIGRLVRITYNNGSQVAYTYDAANNRREEVITMVAADTDGDGLSDSADNCTAIANPNQTDTDSDNIGNACDPISTKTASLTSSTFPS